MKRPIVLPGISEANDVFQLEVGLHVIRVNKKLDFVNKMSCGLIESCRKCFNIFLNRQNSKKKSIESYVELC